MAAFVTDLAKDEEFRIRRALEKVDLVFESNFDEDELRRAQELFGRIVSREMRLGVHHKVVKAFPALTLVTMVGHAGLSYEQGRYWVSFWDEIGVERDHEFENLLRHSLADLLRKFGLREFSEFAGKNYVMAMAMHAGIPVHCLGDLVDLLEEHIQHGRDATGVAFLEWLTEPGMAYRLNRLDLPVRNFLLHAGEITVNILDRIVEFLIFTLEQPDTYSNLELDTSTTGLPTLLLGGLIERVHDRPFLATADVNASARTLRRRRSPAITYSLNDDEVLVGVPYPEFSGDSPWRVSTAGVTRDVYAERGWGVDEGEHPHTLVSITVPTREVTMLHEASSASHRVTVFDSADPLLLFANDGRLIQRHNALPRDLVLAIHPKDAVVVDAVTDELVRSLDDPRQPSGWTGWRVHSLDLSAHNSILVRREGRPDGFVRGVRSVGAPTFDLPEPVAGLFTTNGLSVYSERPSVDLPPYVGNEPELWRVRTRRVGDRQWLTDEEWESDTEETCLDPFDGVDAALLGLYEVVVTGSLGADQRQTLFMAEGIEIDHGIDVRLPVAGGLTPTTSVITSSAGLPVQVPVVELASGDREDQMRVGHAGHAYKLVVRPPFFEFRIDKLGTPAHWRTAQQAIGPADLEDHAVIAVRVPADDVNIAMALIDANGATIQREDADRQSNRIFQLPSRRFVDSARRAGACRLTALIFDSSGDPRQITLADIRPIRLCSGITLVRHELVFDRLVEADDLAVWVWCATAPWQPLRRLGISGGRVELPDDLEGAGDLIAQVFIDDPFAVVPRPPKPDRDAVRIRQVGWVRDSSPVLDELSMFLAGAGKPPLVPEAAPGAWAALALLPRDRTDADSERIRGGLIRIVGKNPRSALEALGNSIISQDDMMALLIETQLIDRAYSASFTLNDLHHNPWIGCMVEISDLPALLEKGSPVAQERAETLAYLAGQGGDDLMKLLRSGAVKDPRSGVFDRNVLAVHAMDDERVDELFEQFRLVPGALLDLDTRTSATIDAFHRRSEWSSDPVCREMASHVNRALREVKKVSPAHYDLINARNEALDGVEPSEHPWMLLSVQSLTLAAVARLEARGELENSPMTADMRSAWALMARYFPAMVAGDLLIADALAAHLAYGDLIGETA